MSESKSTIIPVSELQQIHVERKEFKGKDLITINKMWRRNETDEFAFGKAIGINSSEANAVADAIKKVMA